MNLQINLLTISAVAMGTLRFRKSLLRMSLLQRNGAGTEITTAAGLQTLSCSTTEELTGDRTTFLLAHLGVPHPSSLRTASWSYLRKSMASRVGGWTRSHRLILALASLPADPACEDSESKAHKFKSAPRLLRPSPQLLVAGTLAVHKAPYQTLYPRALNPKAPKLCGGYIIIVPVISMRTSRA